VTLSAGWTVELGIGDPDAVPGDGVYDTAIYAPISFQGNWNFSPLASGNGTFRTGVTPARFQIWFEDQDHVDRKAEMLAAPDPSTVEFVGAVSPSSTWLLTVDTVNDDNIIYSAVYVAGNAQTVPPSYVKSPLFVLNELVDIRWLDTEPVYGSEDIYGYMVDVTQFVQSLDTQRGRDRFAARFRTGTARVVLSDVEGFFTPPASQQPPLGVLPLRPGRAVRIKYLEGTVFTGVVDAFDARQSRDGNVQSVLKCVDRFAAFNRNNPVAAPDQGQGDRTHTRMNRILDYFLDDGTTITFRGNSVATMQSTTMAQTLLAELQITADSEGGGCWIGVNGETVASGFDYFQNLTLEPPRFTVGGSSPIKIWSQDSEWAAIRILNEAHFARAGGSEVVKVNNESIGVYGRRTHTRLDLQNETDDQVETLAQRFVDFAGVDRQRITELVFLPEPGTETAQMAVSADFGDVFRVTVDTIFGWGYTVLSAVFGIEHTVTSDTWHTTFRMDDTLFEPVIAEFNTAEFDDGFA